MPEFLVVYDYGQGGVWARIKASTPEEITTKYPFLEVMLLRPSWMDDGLYNRLETFDIEQPPTGWVAEVVEEQK